MDRRSSTRRQSALGANVAALAFARAAAVATGVLVGAAIGLMTVVDAFAPMIAFAVVGVAIAAVANRLLPQRLRGLLAAIIALAFFVRVFVAVTAFVAASALGRSGFVTGDDAGYFYLARGYANFLHGAPEHPYVPPSWNGDDYLFGTFVYLETALFYLFGPQVLLMEILNSGFAVVTLLLLVDLTRRVFGLRESLIVAVLLAFWPSLVLWSGLNLKEALVLLLVTVEIWLLLRFAAAPRWLLLAAALAVVLPTDSLRKYVFVGLNLIVPISVLAMPKLSLLPRLKWGVVATVAAVVMLATAGGVRSWLHPSQALAMLEGSRRSMAESARTGYVAPPALPVREGETFVVPKVEVERPLVAPLPGTGSSSIDAHEPPTPPAVVRVEPRARLALCVDQSISPPPDTLCVRPGDIVVVGAGAPAPEAQRKPLPLTDRRGLPSVQFTPIEALADLEAIRLNRTLEHIPLGIAFALFAPFPWDLRRLVDVLALPEMLLWYSVMLAVVLSAPAIVSRWRALLPLLLFAAGTFVLFVLAEGNVGILFRHRAMLIPYAIVLASPIFSRLVERLEHDT